MNLLLWLRKAADRAAVEHDWREFNRLRGLAVIAAENVKAGMA